MEHQRAQHARRRIVLISASFGAGHDGAAELTRRLCAEGHHVDRHDFVDLVPRRAGELPRGLHRRQLTTLPRTWGWLFALAGSHRLAGNAAALTATADDATLAAIGTDAAAVSTYPLASQVLGRLRLQGRLTAPAIAYLTGLSVHPLWIADGVDVHLALQAKQSQRKPAVHHISPRRPAGPDRRQYCHVCATSVSSLNAWNTDDWLSGRPALGGRQAVTLTWRIHRR